jgi:pyruvate formate lyase activating enzyme
MRGDGLKISGWNKVSLIDYPGTVATVLFCEGCNLRCPYCHNPGVVRGEFPLVDVAVIEAYLVKRKGAVEGVVFSGGEPTIHAGLPGAVERLRGLGFKIKLDTNGLQPEMIERCNPEYLALDLKTVPERYGELGCPYGDAPERLYRSIAIVKSMKERAEVRITVAPGFIDEAIISAMSKLLSGIATVWLQPLKTDVELLDPEFGKRTSITSQELDLFKKIISPKVGRCEIRGG